MKRIWIGLGLLCVMSPGLAWNALGHRLVAQIALAQLSEAQQAQLSQYNQAVHLGYEPHSLVQSAVWLDWLRCQQPACRDFRHYHYIDYPYSLDGTPTQPPHAVNVLTATRQALTTLRSSTETPAEKGLQLRILMHIVGDAHQPMHAVSLYSREFPTGDQGGNLFALGSNRVAKQLHAYWDRGGGYLLSKKRGDRQVMRLLQKYPCQVSAMDIDPAHWVQESFQLAHRHAYQLTPFQRPSPGYQKRTKQISQQRLALAGCRLGALLQQVTQPHYR